jgi:hypothetical protein
MVLTACGGEGDFSSFTGEGGQERMDGDGAGAGAESADTAGGSLASLSAEEIWAQSFEALQAVDSVRFTQIGVTQPDGYSGVIQADRAGTCVASLSLPAEGSSIELLVREGSEVWLKPNTEFWRAQWGVTDPALLSLFDGNYLHGTSSDPWLGPMAGVCSLEGFFESMTDSGAPDGSGPTEVGAVTEYNGIPAITISGPGSSGGETTVLVATEGEPYPLFFTRDSDGGTEEVELADFNEPVQLVEPPADQVLSMEDFRAEMADMMSV